jgi:hypothetical protein
MSRKKRAVTVAITILLALLGTTVVASPASALVGRIKHWSSGKCLDAAVERGRENLVQIWDCNGGVQQQWIETLFEANDGTACCFELRNALHGYCLEESGFNLTIDLQPCLGDTGIGNPHQLWRVWFAFNPATGGWYQQLQNVLHGGCLQLDDTSNGAVPQSNVCESSHPLNQRWKF